MFYLSNAQKLVDATVEMISELDKSGQLKEGQYGFLTYLLGKKEMSYKDLSIITMSLFADGLSTVSKCICINCIWNSDYLIN